MSLEITYLDSGVLISAFRGVTLVSLRAIQILFVTTENLTKPMHRVTEIQVISIAS